MRSMERGEVQNVVVDCLTDYLESQQMGIEVDDNTQLLGSDSVLDSMGLVNVIIDIESRFSDDGIGISLTSAEAMSHKNSPFRTVSTLVNFVIQSLEAKNE